MINKSSRFCKETKKKAICSNKTQVCSSDSKIQKTVPIYSITEWCINTQIKIWHYQTQIGNIPSLNYVSFPETNYLGVHIFIKAIYDSHCKMISMK